jgi:cytochrome c
MKFLMKALVAAAMVFAMANVRAETPEEARALLEAAITEVKAKGTDAAAREFNAGGKWHRGPLYVVLMRFDNVVIGHSSNAKLIGKNMSEAKDANGKLFVRDITEAHRSKDVVETHFRWANPATKQIGDAVAYSRRVPGQDMWLSATLFK